MRVFTNSILAAGILMKAASAQAAPSVSATRAPQNGLQPQAAIERDGMLHLIYFKGDPAAGDLYYVRRATGAEFSQPIRVNSEPGSAMAVGSIRGAQLAVANGRAHVAWNGHAPKNGTYMDAPMLYTRSNERGTEFERERNVITFAGGLDGGGSVTADEKGNVFVFWHAPKPGNTNGEAGRALFFARSNDQGKTFAREALATSSQTGACGCCGMKAFADSQGNLFALFRSATAQVNRDEILLGGKVGDELKPVLQHPWKIPACPMSSASFANAGTATLAAWESQDNVFFTKIREMKAADPIAPAGKTKRKHPVVCANANGDVLFAWTEGTGWGKGGSVAWQVYSASGETIGPTGRADGLPAWSLPTAVAQPDGNFVIFY